MKNPANVETPQNHPAAHYWAQLGNAGKLESIEVIQNEKRRSVFRLEMSTAHHCVQKKFLKTALQMGNTNTVIAKRAPQADIRKEHYFYQSLLPGLAIPALQTFGIIADADPAYEWLYMADAGSRDYDSDNRAHREMAAAWFANLHIAGAQILPPAGLDDRGPGRFYPYIPKALQTLEAHRSHPSIDAADQSLLDEISDFCLILESNWSEITCFCNTMTPTLVHGDVKEDNMLICGPLNHPSLAVFDWHEGGWGVPALDLAKFLGYGVAPDLDTYLQHWLDFRPQSNLGEIRRLGYIGEIFRWIASVRWHLDDLQYGCIERAISRMRVYRQWKDDIDRAAPWRDNPGLADPNWKPMEKFWV